MRAARLLQMLLLLQNRGRMTCGQLARELEVTRRTILRDVDAMTEAGLPVIVFQGNTGGIELGFNYRTRLTGLAADEAEAMALVLSKPMPELEALGMRAAGERARSKLLESFPDGVREKIMRGLRQFRYAAEERKEDDPRVAALAGAVREGRTVRIRARSREPVVIHPVALILRCGGWAVIDGAKAERVIALTECGDINISAKKIVQD